MTPEERQMLADLAAKIQQTPAPQRDPEAEEFIRTRIGSRPDALYLMTQTVLIQNMAIAHAQQEIEQWKQRAAQTQPAPGSGQGSFLGAPPRPGYGAPGYGAQGGQPGYGAPAGYAPQPGYAPPAAQPAYAAPAASSGGMGSFLRTAGMTAAGVAAGALAFEGIRSLFGHEHWFGGATGLMGGGTGSGFLGGAPGAGETIINNYYDRPADGGSYEDREAAAADGDNDAEYVDADDGNSVDSGGDDSGGYDSGGGGDDDLV